MTTQPRDVIGRWSALRQRPPGGLTRPGNSFAGLLVRTTDPRWLLAPADTKVDGGYALPGDLHCDERKLGPTAGTTLGSVADWRCTVMLSVTGLLDRVGDIIVPGAYADTLQVKTPKIVLFHDWDKPAGKCLAIAELAPGDSSLPSKLPNGQPWPKAAGALVADILFNPDTSWGKDGWGNAKFYGIEQEWSIGYNVLADGAKKRSDGIRLLKGLELLEGSEVLWGAMPNARTLKLGGAA